MMDKWNMMSREAISRMEDLINDGKLSRREDMDKKLNTLLLILAVIGAVAAVAGIAYAVYRYLTPDYLDDFEDDFDDDFEDDLFDEEEIPEPAAE